MPFFSIVIPAYNRAELLPQTLGGLREQSFLDWECIVVDDGSADEKESIMKVPCAQIKYAHATIAR
jgi:glycosyltransferase involved in cell wall biosynthesis